MTSTTRQIIYGITAVVGVIATWYYNILFITEHGGFSLSQFLQATNANPAASSISKDILVAVFAFLFWSYFEARQLKMRHWWLYAISTFVIALAFTFPLFLLMRERKLASNLQGTT
jgi:hypothetical protein